ncbi:MAG TPA: sodium-dependent transporter [Steroidobacteraceae bacterium]|nr:sodium-dependent transporter [Steroidobacteraceae bacterium]
MSTDGSTTWSSKVAFYLAAIGAAVGLGSIWRFPYVAGANGGGGFMFAFLLAMAFIAVPLLIAEFLIGRRGGCNALDSAASVAVASGRSRLWGAIGWLGTAAITLIASYYYVIAGWVVAYTWKCASGQLAGASPEVVTRQFRSFLHTPLEVGAWHLLFVSLVVWISARGVNRGIEMANRIRAPGLLILLLILVTYSLATGDVAAGLAFSFSFVPASLTPGVLLAAVGQAFYATGVGMALMLAYGAYIPRQVSLVRSGLVVSGAIVVVSILATLLIFPLVFRYGMNPAQGPQLVFEVLPAIFAEMPAGRPIGTLFFVLFILAALTPSVAAMEPLVAWLQERRGLSRGRAAVIAGAALWLLGLGSVASFGGWHWRPLGWLPAFAEMDFFQASDFVGANIMLPVGALLTSIFIGWRIAGALWDAELGAERPAVRKVCRALMRYVCPFAIAAILVTAFA